MTFPKKKIVTDLFSTKLGMRLSFVKTLEFRGGEGLNTPTQLGTPLMYIQNNVEALSLKHCCCCCGEEVSITYSEFVCEALFIQHAKRMRHIIWSSVDCLAVQYLSINGTNL